MSTAGVIRFLAEVKTGCKHHNYSGMMGRPAGKEAVALRVSLQALYVQALVLRTILQM